VISEKIKSENPRQFIICQSLLGKTVYISPICAKIHNFWCNYELYL